MNWSDRSRVSWDGISRTRRLNKVYICLGCYGDLNHIPISMLRSALPFLSICMLDYLTDMSFVFLNNIYFMEMLLGCTQGCYGEVPWEVTRGSGTGCRCRSRFWEFKQSDGSGCTHREEKRYQGTCHFHELLWTFIDAFMVYSYFILFQLS